MQSIATFLFLFSQAMLLHDFSKLDEALPSGLDITKITPVFDFDKDGCFPSAGISRTGAQNGGLKPTGKITGGCRNSNFMDLSNTYHRYACATNAGNKYCGHSFALYFLKDQILDYIESGHRHDFEHVMVWTKNDQVVYGSYSKHSEMVLAPVSQIPKQNGHLKFVYHKDSVTTHAFRFAKTDENAENPLGTFVTPTIISWFTMKGDGVTNAQLRNALNTYDYGSAHFPNRDERFVSLLNEYKPAEFPTFSQANADASK